MNNIINRLENLCTMQTQEDGTTQRKKSYIKKNDFDSMLNWTLYQRAFVQGVYALAASFDSKLSEEERAQQFNNAVNCVNDAVDTLERESGAKFIRFKKYNVRAWSGVGVALRTKWDADGNENMDEKSWQILRQRCEIELWKSIHGLELLDARKRGNDKNTEKYRKLTTAADKLIAQVDTAK